jgi:pimeloyl-ACP methyl ester carboxylesterase
VAACVGARRAFRWGVPLPRSALSIAIGIAALYALACVVGRLSYRSILYPAPLADPVPPPAGARILELRAADGVPVHAMDFAARGPSSPTVVYFHGNGEVIGDDVWMAERLVAEGFGVTLVEYRGYGRSRGTVSSEVGLYADASAVLDDLAARGIGPDRVVLWGASLGTGVAIEMARRGRGRALVLVAPYTSIPEMAARVVPFLPVRLVLGDHFDNLRKAPALNLPTVVVHGTVDEVIPFGMGAAVARAIRGSHFETVEGGHHMDCFLADPTLFARVAAIVGR